MRSQPLRVFEHDRLYIDRSIDGVEFKRAHFNALWAFNDRHAQRFFTFAHDHVKCKAYVGVVAVPGLTIEILPKADSQNSKDYWQDALIAMLKKAHGLPLHDAGQAHLLLRSTSVLEHFLRLYVEEVRRLVHQGLVKRYRQKAGVSTALKGRLDLTRHIRHSIVHKELFHVIHQVYDTDHLLHTILKKALAVVEEVTRDPITMGLAQDMQWAFEHVQDRAISAQSFERVAIDRKTKGYANALQLARLLLLNYAPDVKGGREHILSLLFDMNKLFEMVMLKLLQQAVRDHPSITVTGLRNSTPFWLDRDIRPDIIIRDHGKPVHIVDTKWKLPKDGKPDMHDLRQMYAYNLQYGTRNSTLLYPGPLSKDQKPVDFEKGLVKAHDHEHGCAVRYVELFGERGKLEEGCIVELLGRLVPEYAIGTPSPQ